MVPSTHDRGLTAAWNAGSRESDALESGHLHTNENKIYLNAYTEVKIKFKV